MDKKIKVEILKGMAPAVVPVVRAGISSHYENKRFEKRKEYEMQMAEHQSQALATAVGGEQAAAGPQATAEPAEPVETVPTNGGDGPVDPEADPLAEAAEMADGLDQRIADAQQHEDCGFCQDVLDELRHEDPESQKQGLRELRELRGVMHGDASRSEIEETMESFTVVPRLVV